MGSEADVRLIPPFSFIGDSSYVQAVSPAPYAVDSQSLHVRGEMDAFLSAFVLHASANRGELIQEADAWAASGHPYPTLIRRHVEQDFDVVTGGILISQDSLRASPAPLQRYLVDRLRISFGERFNGRGADYYAGVDVSLSHEARVDTVVTSLYDSIRAVSAISRDEITVEQLPTLLAVLDYTKSQLLTLYHASTYGERYGDFRLDDDAYQAGVNKLMRAATQAVQRYYQALVGMPWEGDLDVPDEAEIRAFFAAEQGNPHLRFKLPELNHPLSILGSAYLNAKREPDTTVIVGAPAGGTELAIVTQLALKHVQGSDSNVIFLPISTHSAKVEGDGLEANLVPQLLERHQDDLQGQNVLITDDSSNTGHTIEVIADIVERAGAARVVARTAQADVHRMSIKQHRWAEPTRRLPHPNTATNAVGVVPITRGSYGMADDRQMVKFRAAKLLRHHHAQQEHGIEHDVSVTELEPESTAYAVKICGVHNVVDLERVLAGGTNWIGIHLTYDDPVAYEAKVRDMGSSVATLDNAISQGFYRDRDLPIPWAEFRSIQQTLREIDDKPFDVHTALLMRPRSGAEALRLLNKIVPAGFDKPLYIQLQSAYDPALVADIAEHVRGRYDVQFMQAIGADQEDAADLIAACNIDLHIGMIVLDSQLRGGTGQTSDPDRLTNLAQGIDKPWFLAGGLSADNVGGTLDRLNGVDSTLIGLDLESSVEADEPEVGMHNGAFVKVRKSVDKVGSFVEAVRIHQAQRQYEALDVHGTVFHEALREAWSRTKAETGYFNVRATATYLLESLKARGLYDGDINVDAINAVVSAAIDYPFTPAATSDEVAVTAYEPGAGQPWVVAGARRLLTEQAILAEENGNSVVIFTAGDTAEYGTADFAGSDEQLRRIEVSGLIRDIPDDMQPDVIVHPDKMSIFSAAILDRARVTGQRVVYIEDSVANLQRARDFAVSSNAEVRLIYVGPERDTGFESYGGIEMLAAELHEKPLTGTLIVSDMDGVLLHEDYRSEHQKKNMHCALQALGAHI